MGHFIPKFTYLYNKQLAHPNAVLFQFRRVSQIKCDSTFDCVPYPFCLDKTSRCVKRKLQVLDDLCSIH